MVTRTYEYLSPMTGETTTLEVELDDDGNAIITTQVIDLLMSCALYYPRQADPKPLSEEGS